MIMVHNYDVSNHYSEIESRQLLVMFVTDPFPDGNVMIGDLILGPHWPQKLREIFTNTSHPIEPPVHF